MVISIFGKCKDWINLVFKIDEYMNGFEEY